MSSTERLSLITQNTLLCPMIHLDKTLEQFLKEPPSIPMHWVNKACSVCTKRYLEIAASVYTLCSFFVPPTTSQNINASFGCTPDVSEDVLYDKENSSIRKSDCGTSTSTQAITYIIRGRHVQQLTTRTFLNDPTKTATTTDFLLLQM